MPEGADYRSTLNLPKTDFPMKAELPAREPQRVAWWREHRTYERRLERNAANGPWILHDGPPYANGDLHMGHFLNMVLKDVFVKIALLDGKFAEVRPRLGYARPSDRVRNAQAPRHQGLPHDRSAGAARAV